MRYAPLLYALAACAQQPVEVAKSPTYTEGPVFDKAGNLFFSHHAGVFKLSPAGELSEWIRDAESGFNGHKILPDGTHLICASKKAAVLRFDAKGALLGTAASECEGKPLRAPNDITLDAQGGFYFSDPGGSRTEPIGTVHYVNRSGKVMLSAGGLRVPNGLVLDRKGERLFLAETVPNRILRYKVVSPGILGEKEVFATLPAREGHDATPDGLAVDRLGNLYVAHLGTGQVLVLDERGQLRQRLPGGNYDVSNLVFGGPGGKQLFITGSVGHRSKTEGRVFRLDLEGIPK